MRECLTDLRSARNPKARIKILEGHFATVNSHINTYIDMSTVKCRHNNGRETARVLANHFQNNTMIDTIVCLDGTELIGAFMAEFLADTGIMSVNSGKNISIITPDVNAYGQLVFMDSTLRMIKHMQVLVLAASVTTGQTITRAAEAVSYYGGDVLGQLIDQRLIGLQTVPVLLQDGDLLHFPEGRFAGLSGVFTVGMPDVP